MTFKNINDFCKTFMLLREHGLCDTVIAHADVICDIMNCLIKSYGCNAKNIEVYDSDIYGYEKEFVLTVDPYDEIWVEREWLEDGRVKNPVSATYIHEDCNSRILVDLPQIKFMPFDFEEDK